MLQGGYKIRLFKKHQLTTKKQEKYFYTIGPHAKPVLSIKSGDIVVIETQNTFGGKLINKNTKPSDVEKLPFVNPVNGPIFIEDAKGGDTLKITIESILPRGK